jgi:hypothetical protein
MIRLATLACAITFAAGLPALADGQWTWQGANGGSAEGTRSCTGNGNGGYACAGSSTHVGPNGYTARNDWTSTGTATEGQRTGTTTGPGGQIRTRHFIWQRGN